MVLGVGLRYHQLARTLGGGDENQYLLDYADASLKYIATTYFFGGHPVFHTLLMRLMIMGFGDENAIAIRFPAFLAGIASLWMIYRVALLLFDSLFIARLSLLIAAICPIHIYYSQVGRGYSLIMFFSITMVYALLKLLDAPEKTGWGIILVLCGALSVYTVPTNVYFAAALAGWLFMALRVPPYAEEIKATRKTVLFFLFLFLLMALLSYLLYLPLVDQVIAESKNYHLAHEHETSKLIIAGRVPTGTLNLIFPGPLIGFLPLLVVGVLFGDTVRHSYRLLPLSIFFLPLLVPLLTGVSGYPRNYLYNLPLLVIFLAAGIAKTGQFPGRSRGAVRTAFTVLYVALSLSSVFFEYYPSIKVPDGKLYKQRVREHTGPFDLILFTYPEQFLYARNIFQGNMNNIFTRNKLGAVKIVEEPKFPLADYAIPSTVGDYRIFSNISGSLAAQDVTGGRKLVTLTTQNTASLLPEDFEAVADWRIVSGSGKFSGVHPISMFGGYSLAMEAALDEMLHIEAPVNEVLTVEKPSLMVLARNDLAVRIISDIRVPVSQVILTDHQHKTIFIPPLGLVNDGIRMRAENTLTKKRLSNWNERIFIGIIPPGQYSISLRMAIDQGEFMLFDGIRLFVVEL